MAKSDHVFLGKERVAGGDSRTGRRNVYPLSKSSKFFTNGLSLAFGVMLDIPNAVNQSVAYWAKVLDD